MEYFDGLGEDFLFVCVLWNWNTSGFGLIFFVGFVKIVN
jgi:hypothetical protein